jgi:hypothetical protein
VAHSVDPRDKRRSIHRQNGELITDPVDNQTSALTFNRDPRVNICGCTQFALRVSLTACILCVILFFGVGLGAKIPACFAVGVFCLLISMLFCVIYCAPCCQPGHGMDD